MPKEYQTGLGSQGFKPYQEEEKKEVSDKKKIESGFLIAGFLILVIVLAASATLWFYNRSLSKEIEGISKTMEKKMERDMELDKKVIDFFEVLNVAEALMGSHIITSKTFDIFEKDSLPKVAFMSFSFDSASKKVTMTAYADSYDTVAKQITAFEANDKVQSVETSGAQMSQDGKVNFILRITLR